MIRVLEVNGPLSDRRRILSIVRHNMIRVLDRVQLHQCLILALNDKYSNLELSTMTNRLALTSNL